MCPPWWLLSSLSGRWQWSTHHLQSLWLEQSGSLLQSHQACEFCRTPLNWHQYLQVRWPKLYLALNVLYSYLPIKMRLTIKSPKLINVRRAFLFSTLERNAILSPNENLIIQQMLWKRMISSNLNFNRDLKFHLVFVLVYHTSFKDNQSINQVYCNSNAAKITIFIYNFYNLY